MRSKLAKTAITSVTNIPMMNPDIVTGMSMMLFFAAVMAVFSIGDYNDIGFTAMLISHTTFCLPYVILSVLPRINELGNTLSENGTVCRGVCTVENRYLKDIKELTDIPYDTELSHDTIVSMNMWGLDLGIFEFLGQQFNEFLTANINEPKKEFFLPEVINSRINQKQTPVKVIETNEQWKGVTYPDDAAAVRAAIDGLVANGKYRGMIK